jgi:hypothetical protein
LSGGRNDWLKLDSRAGVSTESKNAASEGSQLKFDSDALSSKRSKAEDEVERPEALRYLKPELGPEWFEDRMD